MKLKISFIVLVALFITACNKPLPEERLTYVGEWQGKDMVLLILRDGSVSYKRLKGGTTTSVTGPLKGFVGDDFVVGFLFLTTTFKVSEAPRLVDGQWTMVVDGVRLTKVDDSISF